MTIDMRHCNPVPAALACLVLTGCQAPGDILDLFHRIALGFAGFAGLGWCWYAFADAFTHFTGGEGVFESKPRKYLFLFLCMLPPLLLLSAAASVGPLLDDPDLGPGVEALLRGVMAGAFFGGIFAFVFGLMTEVRDRKTSA